MRRTLQLGLALGMTILLSACGIASGNQSIVSPAGPVANSINKLWWLFFWICTVAWTLTMLSLAGAIIRRRNAKQVDEAGDKYRLFWVSGAVGLSVLALFVLLVSSTVVGKTQVRALESKNPIAIEVTGHQWWWEVRYPSSPESQIVTTANEIHIPVGVPVVIHTKSADVIHSFWVPNLNGKRDLIPGYRTSFWLQANEPGIYRGQCAEYCGHQHAHMGMVVIAEPMEKFNAWKQSQILPAVEPQTDEQRLGQQVFTSRTCVMCHQIRGTIAGSHLGPDLTHLASRATIGAATLQNHRGNLAGWVMNPQAIKPGVKMPAQDLTPEELNALLAYLESLK